MPMFYVHVPVGNKGTLKQAQLGGAAREPDETDTWRYTSIRNVWVGVEPYVVVNY